VSHESQYALRSMPIVPRLCVILLSRSPMIPVICSARAATSLLRRSSIAHVLQSTRRNECGRCGRGVGERCALSRGKAR
jgi:hypothetical protein